MKSLQFTNRPARSPERIRLHGEHLFSLPEEARIAMLDTTYRSLVQGGIIRLTPDEILAHAEVQEMHGRTEQAEYLREHPAYEENSQLFGTIKNRRVGTSYSWSGFLDTLERGIQRGFFAEELAAKEVADTIDQRLDAYSKPRTGGMQISGIVVQWLFNALVHRCEAPYQSWHQRGAIQKDWPDLFAAAEDRYAELTDCGQYMGEVVFGSRCIWGGPSNDPIYTRIGDQASFWRRIRARAEPQVPTEPTSLTTQL